jgi:hypothetical protein
MATIVVEQDFDCPGSAEDARQIIQVAGGGRGSDGVTALRHYLSADGRRLLALFDAPDTGAVRRALGPCDTGRSQTIWSATSHLSPAPDAAPRLSRSLVVVERSYPVPTPFAAVVPSKEIHRLCFELRGINHVASYVSEDERRILCIDEAADAETVRVANRHAGMAFDRAWHAAGVMEYTSSAAWIN